MALQLTSHADTAMLCSTTTMTRGAAALLVCAATIANAEFFCSPIWGTNGNGVNGGRPRYRVSARTAADVARMNARVAALLPGNGCHTNCNSTNTRFIWFQYTSTSYPFIMDGTCPTPTESSSTHADVYNLVDLDRLVGNGTDFRCGHHRGIGHDAGYYSIVEENCLAKMGTLNAFAQTPVPPTTAMPTNAPTNPPTTRPTSVPTTLAPTTSAPTPHPCNDGSHGCDTSTTQCVVIGGNNYRCDCQPGFQNMPGSSTSCMTMSPTNLPTMQPTTPPPTQAPTARPTMDPCSPGQNNCDPVSTTCANYAFAPYYTCLCNGLQGYIPLPTAVPELQRRCIMTPNPTAPPTFMPTVATTANPGKGMGMGGVNSAGSSTSDSDSSGNTIPIVIIVVLVLVIIIAAALYTRKGSGGGGGAAPGSGPVSFENPMYGDSGAAGDEEYETPVAGGTDGNGGYMDVQGAADDV